MIRRETQRLLLCSRVDGDDFSILDMVRKRMRVDIGNESRADQTDSNCVRHRAYLPRLDVAVGVPWTAPSLTPGCSI